jgi:hypothetical protein
VLGFVQFSNKTAIESIDSTLWKPDIVSHDLGEISDMSTTVTTGPTGFTHGFTAQTSDLGQKGARSRRASLSGSIQEFPAPGHLGDLRRWGDGWRWPADHQISSDTLWLTNIAMENHHV